MCTIYIADFILLSIRSINVAAAIAKSEVNIEGEIVCGLDFDSQCNKTSYLLDDTDRSLLDGEDLQENSEGLFLSQLFNQNDSSRAPTVKSYPLTKKPNFTNMEHFVTNSREKPMAKFLKTLFEGVGGISAMTAILEDKVNPCVRKCNEEHFGDSFYIFEGSVTVGDYEAYIERAFNGTEKNMSLGALHTGFLKFMMDVLNRVYGFTVFIIDSSPAKSQLNQALGLCCDYILPPVFADVFSATSVHSLLTEVLGGERGWIAKHKEVVAIQYKNRFVSANPEVLNWRIPLNPPRLLPFIVTNFPTKKLPKLRKRTKGIEDFLEEMTYMPQQFVYCMKDFIDKDKINAAERDEVRIEYEANNGDMIICLLPTLEITSICQELGCPFVEVTREHLDRYWGIDDGIEEETNNLDITVSVTEGQSSSSPVRIKRKYKKRGSGRSKVCPNFEEEIEIGRQQYKSLAAFVVHLLNQKRNR